MMPGIVQGGGRSGNATEMASSALSGAAGSLPASRTIWSRQRDDVCFEQLKKFWGELPIQARRELLRIDKLTLCEQARKNLYCSRCHGLLLECFSRIVMYGKSLLQEHACGCCSPKANMCKVHFGNDSGNLPDPSIHPWGGLDTTKDGILTLLDRFICARSLDVLQKVFDSARQREHDRELLYPNACGGGGRGWTSQGLTNSGRGHVTRESCALHTSRLSCDTLLDFWSALGDETRLSLLRMKEDDFIERLMYRFDSKRFCRDCRRNVLREFKELKELKRMRKELHCTSWFCIADTAFQCEVTQDSIQADWQHSFTDIVSTYHHFEWAVGTGEGKNDILDFEDVGLSGKVQSNALDLSSLSACFITLRAWKLDGRCTELCVKAHVLKGQSCVHRRLLIGDGFVSITKGDGIRSFLEHAEEAEEDEDDDSNDKDGSGLDGDGSRPQKHAKSPELAREFLLDAATVIFKEQVEKAFREGTAWQNAHSLFVSLAIKLLEERVHVACKGIVTLEKQIKLLEEEENEKQEVQERKERRKNREREKKLRRKERLKQKEMERERKHIALKPLSLDLSASLNNLHTSNSDESLPSIHSSEDTIIDLRDSNNLADPICANTIDDNSPNQCTKNVTLRSDNLHKQHYIEGELHFRGRTRTSDLEQSKSSRLSLSLNGEALCNQDSKWYDVHRSAFSNETNFQHDAYGMKLKALSRCFRGGPRALRERAVKRESINCTLRVSEKFDTSYGRNHDSYDSQSCRCNQPGEYRLKDGYSISTITGGRDKKSTIRADSKRDVPRKLYRCNKQNRGCYITDKYQIPKGKLVTVASGRDAIHTRQVWEPMGVQKYSIGNSETDVPLRTAAIFCTSEDIRFDKDEKSHQRHDHEPSAKGGPSVLMSSSKIVSPNDWDSHKDNSNCSNKFDENPVSSSQIGFLPSEKSLCCSNYISEGRSSFSVMPTLSVSHSCHVVRNSSSSDNISSFLSEVDSSTCSSSTPTTESTSDSEDSSQQSVGRDISVCNEDVFHKHQNDVLDSKFRTSTVASSKVDTSGCPSASYTRTNLPRESTNIGDNSNSGSFAFHVISPKQHSLPVHSHINMPVFPSTTMVYQNQNAVSWSAAPTKGFLPHSQNQYQFHPHRGYGLPLNRSPAFGMLYDIIHPPVTSNMVHEHHHHHLHNGTKRIFSTCPKEQLKNVNTYRVEQANKAAELMQNSSQNKLLPLELPSSEKHWTKKISPVAQESSQSFSLFHFGGPLVGAATSGKEHTNSISVSPESPENIEEYSLFATGNGSRFSFSSFTL